MIAALLLAAWTAAKPPVPPHPLDPLSPAELQSAVATLRASKLFAEDALIPLVALQEPPKSAVKAGAAVRRQAMTVVFDRRRNETSEAVVDLASGAVVSWRVIPNVQPNMLLDELETMPAVVRADERWAAAMRRRGIENVADVYIDIWAPGAGAPEPDKARIGRGVSFLAGGSSNPYARPIEGVVAVVDLNARSVIDVIDADAPPVSTDPGELGVAPQAERPAMKPMRVEFPDGASYARSGWGVSWDGWRFRLSMHPREGLVLHDVRWEQGGRSRDVLYRGSISEMVVPYGDPDPNWGWRAAFDAGEYGLGRMASPLEPDADVPGYASFLDAHFVDELGAPFTIQRAVGIYERDGGLLWRHHVTETGKTESRRGRELVVASVATIGNYDYLFRWVFRQDASLEAEADLTGIMLAKGVAAGGHEGHAEHYWHRVSSQVAAPHHQHFFNYRLDLDVDGAANSVVELNSKSLPAGRENPFGNAFAMETTPLASEKSAQRDLSLASGRRWIVVNPASLNELGQPAGFALAPGDNAVPLSRPDSAGRKRAGFVDHAFWATAQRDEEIYAAGAYPYQGRRAEGLPRWTGDDESLEGADVVVWYTMGTTHIPRPEEWPVMPTARIGFKLLPTAFFSRNPALDVPRPSTRRKRRR